MSSGDPGAPPAGGSPGQHRVLCLTTGGSIDKTYSGAASDFVVGRPVARSVVGLCKCAHGVAFREVCRKDSLELSDEDREALAVAVESAREKLIVITHGTDTMARTASYVKDRARRAGKVVVLTGAMRPEAFKDSDAAFNLGSALTVAPYLAPGAHLVMHGAVFSAPETVVKDTARDVITTTEALEQQRARSDAAASKKSQRRTSSNPSRAAQNPKDGGGPGDVAVDDPGQRNPPNTTDA
eukprot:CAMPEP_0185703130 /NCGR_PEP_ID=MMETSP1164-20130828/13743_1 /TAXON_ID=1104430 /ORGANISM="Chrysoreinhardia sp, Strain CCMP2950" /LENGTH=239 /DNA_ID=CAMNT_0028370401 /DNA_START=40 /DNA_END=755 /DNA_ORIENTATION=-